MASRSAGAPALNYGDVNRETTSLGEVKGLMTDLMKIVKGNKKDLRHAVKEIDAIMKKRYKILFWIYLL